MRIAFALGAIMYCCCSLTFGQDAPRLENDYGEIETAQLKRQITQLASRIAQLESEISKMKETTSVKEADTVLFREGSAESVVGAWDVAANEIAAWRRDANRIIERINNLDSEQFSLTRPSEARAPSYRFVNGIVPRPEPLPAIISIRSGLDEGMIIDAIEHKMRWRLERRTRALR